MKRLRSPVGFRFRLESLLRLREWEKERCTVELAKRISRVQTLRSRLADMEATLAREWERFRAGAGVLDPTYRSLYGAYTRHILDEMASCRVEIEGAERAVDGARRAWTDAERRYRLLEKLREREVRTFERESARREQMTLDEVASRSRPVTLVHSHPGKGVQSP